MNAAPDTDDCGCPEIDAWLRRRAEANLTTGRRIAAEVIAAVKAGVNDCVDWPESYQRVDTYADCGDPDSEVIMEIVNAELTAAGIDCN